MISAFLAVRGRGLCNIGRSEIDGHGHDYGHEFVSLSISAVDYRL